MARSILAIGHSLVHDGVGSPVAVTQRSVVERSSDNVYPLPPRVHCTRSAQLHVGVADVLHLSIGLVDLDGRVLQIF